MTSSISSRLSLSGKLRIVFCVLVSALCLASPTFAQTENRSDNGSDDSKAKILAEQKRLAEQYELLEKKLFSLYQYEQNQNPDRAELLQKAFQQSREKLTLQQFQTAVELLGQSRLREAQSNQRIATAQLQELLELLQSEDRSKRIREQLKRFQEYNREIGKILRTQQGIRGQAENQGNKQSIEDAQQRVAERTRKLKEKIEQDQSAENAEQGNGDSESGESKSGESKSGESKSGESKSGQGQQGGTENSESPSDSDPNSDSPQDPVESANQRLQNAAQKMQQAQQKLQEAQRENSIERMREAERELEQAKRELEKILRQLREEEIQRTLDSLEASFRKMLQAEVKLNELTVALDGSREDRTVDDLEIQSARLGTKQNELVNDAARVLLILEDEGSAIATMEAVRQVQSDMQQITNRLNATNTGQLTQQLQIDVIESLSFLVEVFEKAKQDQKQKQQQQDPSSPNQGEPGEQALLNQLTELKLIRGMQQQILSRHERYAKLVPDPNSKSGHSDDPGLQVALERLSQRQKKLQRITSDIFNEQGQ